jgi:hypothetical protein
LNPLQQADSGTPVKVAIVPDQTGSRTWTRTPRVSSQNLSPLIDLLRSRGGEIGVGLIRDDSNRSLVRLRVDRPPAAPKEPDEEGNAFVLLEQRTRYIGLLEKYEEGRAGWEEVTREQINTFVSTLEPLLNPARAAAASDVWGALRRVDSFLAEDDTSWGGSASRWAVLVTDGQDNVGVPMASLASGAQLLVVNGSGSMGALAHLDPTQFESLDAALRHLVAREESR